MIKLEKLNECFCEALHEFLGIKLESLSISNASSNKTIFRIYRTMKDNIKFERDKLCEIYGHNYVKDFYSSKEILGFIDRHSS